MNINNPLKQLLLLIAMTGMLLSCQNKKISQMKSVTILSINDVYRTEGLNKGQSGGLARVRTLRKELQNEGKNVLFLHAGDFLQPSFSSRVNKGEAMIDVMNHLDGVTNQFDDNMIVAFGNHEFDKGKMKYMSMLQQRIDESEFSWMDSNINWKIDAKLGSIKSDKLHKWLIKDVGGIKIGIYSLITDMSQPEYIAGFDNPFEVSKHYVQFLKTKKADIIIALTHQQVSDDRKIMQMEVRPDLIIGGHEHYKQKELVNGRWIVKADADAVSAAVTTVNILADNTIQIEPAFVELDTEIMPDSMVEQVVKNWKNITDTRYCQNLKQSPECLDESYGVTKVDLIAEESEIRRFETNLGDYLADAAKNEFEVCNADAALINSGSIRLNYDIPANSDITKKHVEGMFPYPSDLKLIRIRGKTLKQMLTHDIDMWTANGHWLLVSGIKFVHDPENQTFSSLKLSSNDKLIGDDQLLNVVVPQYLIDKHTDHDGYSMINEDMIIECDKNGAGLKQLFIKQVKYTPNGIAPLKDGRVCNTLRDKCEE